jgi:stress-induced morphogen
MKEIIERRLHAEFNPEFLEVIDESFQHAGHSGNPTGEKQGTHFSIIIKCEGLGSLSLLAAHRSIYVVLADIMPKIHALRIKVMPH